MTSITVTPASPSISKGSAESFTATGHYAGGSTQNVTNSVTWTSSNAAVASISNSSGSQGLASGLAQGTSTITASYGSVAGSTVLTVGPAALVSLAVTPANPSLARGATEPFTATGTYTDGSTQNLTSSSVWTSSNTAVATIGNSGGSPGLAQSLAQGMTTITAMVGAINGSTVLTVGPPTLVSLALTPANGSIALGTTQQLVATGTFTDGSTQNLSTQVTWASSALTVATVSNVSGSQGLVTSAGIGTTTVSATSGSITGSTAVTVTPATLVSIAVTPAIPSIALGTTQQFTATGTFTDGSFQNISNSVQWGSSSSAVATMSNTSGTQGLATSVGTGTTAITATSGLISGSTTLAVTSATLVSVTLSPPNSLIALGTTQPLSATGTFTDGSQQALTSSATWSSSDAGVATVSPTGLVTAVAVGTTTITASSGSVSGSTTLTVGSAGLVSIAVSPASASIALGTSQQFTATGTFTDGSYQNITSIVYWTSSAAGVATVSDSAPTVGLASSVGTGATSITATSGSITGSAVLTVTPAALVAISVAPQNPSIPLGTTQQFAATGTFTDGSNQDITASATWSSSSVMVAIVSNTAGTQGLSTSAGVGTTTITATLGALAASTVLTVNNPQLVSIAIGPLNPVVTLGATQQFSATGTYTDGSKQDVTASATWSSSNPGIAGVNVTGLATTSGVGSTTIAATVGAVSSSTILTVTSAEPVLMSITVTPSSPSISAGMTQQFTATGNYSDGSTQNLTTSASWSSSNPAVAAISNSAGSQGFANTSTQGSTTIIATAGLISGTATLTVMAPALVSISISPATASILVGQTQQFTAAGTFTGGSTSDVTGLATWASSNTTSVVIQSAGQTNPGLASAQEASPSLTVSATYGGQSATAIVTVSNPITPINDLGADFYLGLYQGGFYPGGSNTEPTQHGIDGATFAGQIQPLNTSGNPSSSGAIVVVSEGMSVALSEFTSFVKLANSSGMLASGVVLLNEATSNNDACIWITGTAGVQPTCCMVPGNQCASNGLGNPPANQYDRICGNLPSNGRSCNQVQAVWIDTDNGNDHSYMWGCFLGGSGANTVYVLCNSLDPNSISNNSYQLTDALNLEWELGQEVRASKLRFPNLKQVFLSSRAYAGYCTSNCASPEPKAYEVAFAIKWLIQAQIDQCPTSACTGPIDPVAGDMGYTNAAWVDWSYDTNVTGVQQAYLWANGDSPRSDGLVWCHGGTVPQAAPCGSEEDFVGPDWLHMSTVGGDKAGQLILNFFLNSTYTAGWFRK